MITATTFRPGYPFEALLSLRRNPLQFLQRLCRDTADVHTFRIGWQEVWVLRQPEWIGQVLTAHPGSFEKPLRRVATAQTLMSEGLLRSDGDVHMRQRRLMQPAFHRARMDSYGQCMIDLTSKWEEELHPTQAFDMHAEMMQLTMSIVGQTLLGTDIAGAGSVVRKALHDLLETGRTVNSPFAAVLQRFSPGATRRFEQASKTLYTLIGDLVIERRSSGEDRGDLLSMLVQAPMSDSQLLDEILTIFLAGHETTANALTWTWYLLSTLPEVEAQLHAELDSVLNGRPPSPQDYPRLVVTRRILAESMRLYPPAWTIARRATQPVTLGPHTLPSNAIVLMSQWLMHHDERYFDDPYRFRLDRWLPEAEAARPRYAYFPFGGGNRQCIGEHFAWMEGVLILATIAQKRQFNTLPGQSIVPQARVTLRPRYGLRMQPAGRLGGDG